MHVFAALHGRKSATMLGSLTSTGVRMPHRILVVDAHPLNRLVVAEQLATLGHAPLCVDDAEQALALLDASRFDLVVAACRMPGTDGFSLAARRSSREVLTNRSHCAPLRARAGAGARGRNSERSKVSSVESGIGIGRHARIPVCIDSGVSSEASLL